MADKRTKCGICGEMFDPSWTKAKRCTHCDTWHCPKCSLPSQCRACKKNTLKSPRFGWRENLPAKQHVLPVSGAVPALGLSLSVTGIWTLLYYGGRPGSRVHPIQANLDQMS